MGRYLDLFRTPGVAPLLVAGAIARLPYGMSILALILLLRAEGFPYSEVGVVTAASGVAVGATAPLLGRAVDRSGQSRVLVICACVCLTAQCALAAAALNGAGVVALAAVALVGGASTPPVSPSMRTLWPDLVGRERLDTAFAFDALQLEVFFITGPLIVAAIASAASSQAAFLTAAVMESAGAIGFAAAPASRRWRPTRRGGRALTSALSAPGMRMLVVAFVIGGVSVGAVEIGIPAFAEQEGTRGDSGWLFALWAFGSLAGGLWYGARRWRLPAARRFVILTGLFAIGLAPLPFAASLPVFAALVVVAGLALAPSTAAAYSLIGELAPEGSTTESYGWQIVGYVVGGACGAWLGGILVDELSVAAALALAPATAACVALVALGGLRTWTATPALREPPRRRGRRS
jgi:MFS family permease